MFRLLPGMSPRNGFATEPVRKLLLAFMAAVRALDKAHRVAEESKNVEMTHSLETARAALGEQLVRMGVRAPIPRGSRKRKAG